MRLLFSYLSNYKKILFFALFLAFINQAFSLLDPQIFRLIIDNYATRIGHIPQGEFIRGVVLLLLASMGVALVSRTAKNFQDYYVNVATQRVGARMYQQSVSHSFSLPYSIFEDQRSGQLLQNLSKARDDAQKLITSSVNTVFLSLVGIIIVIGYAFTVNWLIGSAYFLVIPAVGTAMFYTGRKIKAFQKEIVAQTAELAGSTTETMRNVELVKSLGLESQEAKRLNDVNGRILELELKKVKFVRKISFLQGTIINAVRSLIMLLMLWLVFNQSISLGQFFTLLFYSFAIFSPLADLGPVSSQYQETRASMDILQKILSQKSQPKPEDPVPLGSLQSIRFENVSFAYQGGISALGGVNIAIGKGETVAFVGPSGSGKSTLVKLLVGLYKPTAGRLVLNGIDSSRIDYEEFRTRVGYVSQETQLFAGTIRENLLFVNPQASDEDCIRMLKAASALPIIERGGHGLDTKIGEGGIKISGGERQRLAIARALLRHPEILIFDEATSSLDSITEKAITETIREVSNIRSDLITVLVAHRLSTVSHADKIYVLAKGRITEEGSHQNLLRAENLYAALWREQSAQRAA